MPAQYHIVAQYKHSHISLESKKTIKKRKKQITRNSLASRSIRDGIREKKNTQEKDQIEQKGDQAMDKKEEKKKKNKQMDQEDGTKKMKLTKETKLPGKYEPTTHPSLPFCWKFQHKSFTVCLHPKSWKKTKKQKSDF